MIRATSTFSKWVVIDNIEYRFQALQFHSNVLGVFKAGQSMSFCGEEYEQKRSKRISTSSIETIRSRKTSVVQIKTKDETSDYHSDDDDTSEEDDIFATVCYVNGCSIKNTTRLSVSDIREGIAEDFQELLDARDEQIQQEPRRRHSVSGSKVYNAESLNQETLTKKFKRRTSAWEMKSRNGLVLPNQNLVEQTVYEEAKD